MHNKEQIIDELFDFSSDIIYVPINKNNYLQFKK